MAETRTDTMWAFGTGSATLAAIAGAAALVLSILGLAKVVPATMLDVATIVVGAGLLIEGSALTASFAQLRSELRGNERAMVGGGISAEMLGGVVVAVLGVLALLGTMPMILVPVAAIVGGGALLVGGGAQERARRMLVFHEPRTTTTPYGQVDVRTEPLTGTTTTTTSPTFGRRDEKEYEYENAAFTLSSGADVLVGLGAVALGIIALLGTYPMILSLAAMLALGGAILLGGGAIGGRLANLFHRVA